MEQIEQAYCPSCKKLVSFSTRSRQRQTVQDGKSYVYRRPVAICESCGSEAQYDPYDAAAQRALGAAIEAGAGIVTPDEIRRLPHQYAIGKRPLSRLLGWGELTYTRLLDGRTPNAEHSAEIHRLLSDPAAFAQMLELGYARGVITGAAYAKSRRAVDDLLGLAASCGVDDDASENAPDANDGVGSGANSPAGDEHGHAQRTQFDSANAPEPETEGGCISRNLRSDRNYDPLKIFAVADRFCALFQGDVTPRQLQSMMYAAQLSATALGGDAPLFDAEPEQTEWGARYPQIDKGYSFAIIQATAERLGLIDVLVPDMPDIPDMPAAPVVSAAPAVPAAPAVQEPAMKDDDAPSDKSGKKGKKNKKGKKGKKGSKEKKKGTASLGGQETASTPGVSSRVLPLAHPEYATLLSRAVDAYRLEVEGDASKATRSPLSPWDCAVIDATFLRYGNYSTIGLHALFRSLEGDALPSLGEAR